MPTVVVPDIQVWKDRPSVGGHSPRNTCMVHAWYFRTRSTRRSRARLSHSPSASYLCISITFIKSQSVPSQSNFTRRTEPPPMKKLTNLAQERVSLAVTVRLTKMWDEYRHWPAMKPSGSKRQQDSKEWKNVVYERRKSTGATIRRLRLVPVPNLHTRLELGVVSEKRFLKEPPGNELTSKITYLLHPHLT